MRRQWHPTPVLLPGKSHGQRSLVGCSPWGRKESDTTEQLHFCFSLSCRKWQPTPMFLPGESQGWGSPLGCHLWGRTESDTTEQLHFHFTLSCFGEGNGNPLQCSCLENPRDGGTWPAAVYGVAQSRHDWSDLAAAYCIGVFLSGSLHSVYWAPVSSTSLELIQMYSFWWLSNTPLRICTTAFLSIHLLMDI